MNYHKTNEQVINDDMFLKTTIFQIFDKFKQKSTYNKDFNYLGIFSQDLHHDHDFA